MAGLIGESAKFVFEVQMQAEAACLLVAVKEAGRSRRRRRRHEPMAMAMRSEEQVESLATGVSRMMTWAKIKVAALWLGGITVVARGVVTAEISQQPVPTSAPTTAAATLPAAPGKASAFVADVFAKVQEAQSVSFQIAMALRLNGRSMLVTSEVLAAKSLPMRQTTHMPGGVETIQITDFKAGKMLSLIPGTMQASVIELTGMSSDRSPQNVLDTFTKLHPEDAAMVGDKTIDGRATTGFRIDDNQTTMTVWADAATHLPVQIDLEMHSAALVNGLSATESNFHWNQKIDESLLSLTPPAGYHVQAAKLDGSRPKESDVIQALSAIAELNDGEYPDTLDTNAITKVIQKATASMGVAVREKAGGTPKAPDNRALIERLQKVSAVVSRALVFYGNPSCGSDWHYAGNGALAGEAGVPILWYRPTNSSTYRVIDADLNAHDVAPQDLPKVPSILFGPASRPAAAGASRPAER